MIDGLIHVMCYPSEHYIGAYKGVLHYVFADTACFDPEAHKASCSIPGGYRVILVKASACRISTSIV